MGTRGPKSAAEMAVAPIDEARKRPPPPEGLTDDQADVWRRTVAALPAGWIHPEHLEIMAAYCRHAIRFRELSKRLDSIDVEKVGMMGGFGIDTYSKLRRAAESESRAMLACARSLRITIQATMRPETAGRQANRRPEIPATWNGSDEPGKPWEQ